MWLLGKGVVRPVVGFLGRMMDERSWVAQVSTEHPLGRERGDETPEVAHFSLQLVPFCCLWFALTWKLLTMHIFILEEGVISCRSGERPYSVETHTKKKHIIYIILVIDIKHIATYLRLDL